VRLEGVPPRHAVIHRGAVPCLRRLHLLHDGLPHNSVIVCRHRHGLHARHLGLQHLLVVAPLTHGYFLRLLVALRCGENHMAIQERDEIIFPRVQKTAEGKDGASMVEGHAGEVEAIQQVPQRQRQPSLESSREWEVASGGAPFVKCGRVASTSETSKSASAHPRE
jgi:hypothetical protein